MAAPQIPHVLSLGGAPRAAGWLDDVSTPPRSLDDVQGDIPAMPRDGRWLLQGGEPTLRADLLSVIGAARTAHSGEVWLRTDGLALVSAPVCVALRRAGLDGVRVALHCGRADAHDWLVGLPGAAKRVSRAIRTAVSVGLKVEVEVALTRPTAPHLEETVALAIRLGATGLWIRRVRPMGAALSQFIAISPRMGQLRGVLEAAMRVADDARVPIHIAGVPHCVLPSAVAELCGDGAASSPCSTCPGPPVCAGVPTEYTERFGWSEIWRLTPRQSRETAVVVVDAQAPTREIRMHMLHAAQLRPRQLRLVDVAAHPEALSLLRDALRLSVPSVSVSGRISQLAEIPETALFRLRALSRVDAAAQHPDDVPSLRAALRRLPADVATGVYGLARSAAEVNAFSQAGVDAVRLLEGGRLDALPATMAAHLCPPCLGGDGCAPIAAPKPWKGQGDGVSTMDWQNVWKPCPHAAECSAQDRCPGLVSGWKTDGVAALR